MKTRLLAITTKEISGQSIATIPIGTTFTITGVGNKWSSCEGLGNTIDGLGITLIWNDEYEFVKKEGLTFLNHLLN